MKSTAGQDMDGQLPSPLVLDNRAFASLLQALVQEGYTLIGPTPRDGAVMYEPIHGVSDLPTGWTDTQEPGRYRLEPSTSPGHFDHQLGAQSFKPYLVPPRERLLSIRRARTGELTVDPSPAPEKKLAFVGVRSCDLSAIAVQDVVFLHGPAPDPRYLKRRQSTFTLAVNCTSAASTCFCTSMGTGPRARGADLVMTEVVTPETHHFVVEEASLKGKQLLARIPHRPATPSEFDTCEQQQARAVAQIDKRLDTHGLPQQLAQAHGHARWNEVAQRCLGCASCTMVCPTCFCSTVEDTVEFSGARAERIRRWDSCFNREFSELHGKAVRGSIATRYRQWLTHKLSTWHEQFGTSGCVGCGRCITFCPVGIDITAEAAALQAHNEP